MLDNCEHVLGAVVPLVQRLSRHCVRLTVLATGRAPLGLPGELVHVLAPLGVPARGAGGDEVRSAAAVQLFADRAAEARPGFQLDERNLAAAAKICRKLDGLPLAIELAAARMRSIGAEALADRLDQRFALLAGQRANVDPRHQSLHRLVEWSYELLDPADREAFAHLAAFAGSFDLEAAEVVCRPTPDGFERAGTCRDRSGRPVHGAGGRSRRASVPAAGDVARVRPGAPAGDRVAGAGRGALPRVVPRRRRAGRHRARHRGRGAMGVEDRPRPRQLPRRPRRCCGRRRPRCGQPTGGCPSRVLLPASALRDRRLGRGHDADGGLRGLAIGADRAGRRGLRAMGARRPRCREGARSPLDRRRQLARRAFHRPRGAGPRQRRLLQRGDGGRVGLDGADGRRRRSERPRRRPDPRAVHVVRGPHVGR